MLDSDWKRITKQRWFRKMELQRAREFDAKEDRLSEAIRDGALGPVSWSFIDLLTDADMEMLRGMRISWHDV